MRLGLPTARKMIVEAATAKSGSLPRLRGDLKLLAEQRPVCPAGFYFRGLAEVLVQGGELSPVDLGLVTSPEFSFRQLTHGEPYELTDEEAKIIVVSFDHKRRQLGGEHPLVKQEEQELRLFLLANASEKSGPGQLLVEIIEKVLRGENVDFFPLRSAAGVNSRNAECARNEDEFFCFEIE